jgi:hypothetical protein
VNVSRKNGKILVFINENAFVSALVKMAGPIVPPVVITGIGDIEMAHELGEVAFGGFNEQVEVVRHEDVAVKLYAVNVDRLDKYLEEPFSVGIVLKDVIAFVASAGNVVHCAGILDAERSGHGKP